MPRTVIPLVGRATELAVLQGALKQASSASAAAVVLDGDAGVGKTRVLAELAAQAQGEGFLALIGHCVDLGDTPPPYLPFTEAFGRLRAESPDVVDDLIAVAEPITRLVPGRAGEAATARVERGELFEAVLAGLSHLARRSPVLLIVEDVHWADQATRDLLGFLFTRLSGERIALVTSYRSDDLDRRHPLRPVLAQWSRLPVVERAHLDPLSAQDVRELVRLLQSGTIDEENVENIVRRAEGNAFFAEELVAAAEQCGCDDLPWQLADLLLVRLDRLSADARRAVRAAAVAGRRVSHDLLAAVVDLEHGALDEALRHAVDAHVLELTPSGRGYLFRHALLAEAVYDDLLPGERARVHAAYAAALVARGSAMSAELARHARASHDLPTAYRASVDAGHEAMAMAAPQEAMQHFRTALDLAAQTHVPVAEQAPIAVALVDAAVSAGRWFKGVRLAREALAQLSPEAEPLTRAQLLYALAFAMTAGESDEQTLSATTEALQLVPAQPPTPLRARLMSLHATLNHIMGRPADAERWASEAVELGRALDLPDVIADAGTTLAKITQRSRDPDEVARRLIELAEAAHASGQLTGEVRSLHTLGSLYYENGALAQAQDAYDRAAARACDAGRPWTAYGTESRVMAGLVRYVRGDWDGALRTLDVHRDSPPEQARALLVATALAVRAGRGDTTVFDELPLLRRWWARDGRLALYALCGYLHAYEIDGRLDDALALIDEVIRALSALWMEEHFLGRIRVSALALAVVGAAAGAATSAGRPELARKGRLLVEEARTSAEQGLPRGRQLGGEGLAWLARAEAEWCRARWLLGVDAPSADEHIAAWQRAVEAFDYGDVYELARSRARLAAVLRAAGRGGEAAQPATQAREVARALGAEPLLEEIRALGLRPAPNRGPDSPGGPESLTAREREVLACLVDGRTNRQIAGQLYISEKTVSVHVSNILAKLGVRSRAEAAAFARREGLLSA